MIVIRARDTGDKIESFNTLDEAKETLARYQEQDKTDGLYEEDFYEIYDGEKEEIVYQKER